MKKAFLFLSICFVLFSCSDMANEKNPQGGIIISIEKDIATRTVMPGQNQEKALESLEQIVLEGKPSSQSDYKTLRQWNSYAALQNDNGVIYDAQGETISGSWDFKLSATIFNTKVIGSVTKTISKTEATSVNFSLSVDPASTNRFGKVIIASDFLRIVYDKIIVTWNSEKEVVEKNKNFEKILPPGDYEMTLTYYDADDNVLLVYPTCVIVEAAQLSFQRIYDLNQKTYMCYDITYDYNGGSNVGKSTEVEKYIEFLDTRIKDGSTLTPPVGKEFRGWNTKKDGSGTRYSKGDKLDVAKDTTLYAQWCTYNETDEIYTISSEEELFAFFSYRYNKSSTSNITQQLYHSNVKLLKDITLTHAWEPQYFGSTFDGNRHSISNITMAKADYEKAGFLSDFSDFEKGEIKNLTIKSSNISTTNQEGYAGAIAGIIRGNITNCSVENVTITAKYAGGIAAQNKGEITGSSVTGSSTIITGTEAAGGIAGTNTSSNTKITTCNVDGIKIVSTKTDGAKSKIGGIAGKNESSATITSPTVNNATIEDGGYAYYVAGVAGYNDKDSTITDATVTNSTITGNENLAYVNEIAVGISGTINGVITKTGNTIIGNNSTVEDTYSITYATRIYYYGYISFNLARRQSSLSIKVDSTIGDTTALLYKKEINAREHNTMELPKLNGHNSDYCIWWSEYGAIKDNSVFTSPQIKINPTASAYTYTFRIYNSNGEWNSKKDMGIKGSYCLKLE